MATRLHDVEGMRQFEASSSPPCLSPLPSRVKTSILNLDPQRPTYSSEASSWHVLPGGDRLLSLFVGCLMQEWSSEVDGLLFTARSGERLHVDCFPDN
jgi:hypothetical protein